LLLQWSEILSKVIFDTIPRTQNWITTDDVDIQKFKQERSERGNRLMTAITSTVREWSGVHIEPHDRDGQEFTLAHPGRVVDIPFIRRVRDILIEEGLAEKHHIHPDSGWASSYIEDEGSVERALWLLRVSYLYHAISMRNRSDSEALVGIDVEQELGELDLSDDLQSVFADFLEQTARSP
jgi:hypothetical protein